MKTIILVRHGESATNIQKVFCGQLNAPLTELGKKQAQLMAEYIDRFSVDKVYASSLDRAVETAMPIAQRQNCPLEKCDALKEINAGLWQGKTYEEISVKYPENYKIWKTDIGRATPEGGETCAQFYDRVTTFFKGLLAKEQEQTICLVAHAVIIRMIESYMSCGSIEAAQELGWVPNASVSVYRYDGVFTCLVRGCCDYLGEMRTELPKSI